MRGVLFQYELNATTWVYLSSLMIIAVYFKFRRFWSLRNLDLVALIALSPGLLLIFHGVKRHLDSLGEFEQRFEEMVYGSASSQWLGQVIEDELFAERLEQLGYVWLFGVGSFFLIRLFLDPFVVRRPLLEPNLSAGGLAFSGIALLIFLMSNVANPQPAQRLEHFLDQQSVIGLEDAAAATPLSLDASESELPDVTTPEDKLTAASGTQGIRRVDTTTSRLIVIVAQLAIVLGMVLIGYRHFDNIQTGVAVATLYLMLPYTSQLTSRVDHVVPAALLVWALQSYRRPIVAGLLIGVAAGAIFYPIFLLPLWCSFYWQRGVVRFSVATVVGLLGALLAQVLLHDQGPSTFAWISLWPDKSTGFWHFFSPAFRIPLVTAFGAGCLGLGLWPAQKNLGVLLSCSAAVMLGVQFWHAEQGGLCMAWYLPLLLLTIFRPNLEDRVALSAVVESPARKKRLASSAILA